MPWHVVINTGTVLGYGKNARVERSLLLCILLLILETLYGHTSTPQNYRQRPRNITLSWIYQGSSNIPARVQKGLTQRFPKGFGESSQWSRSTHRKWQECCVLSATYEETCTNCETFFMSGRVVHVVDQPYCIAMPCKLPVDYPTCDIPPVRVVF